MSEPETSPREPVFTSEDTLVVVFEGPGDNTRRPRRPNIPRDSAPREPHPPEDQPPAPPAAGGK